MKSLNIIKEKTWLVSLVCAIFVLYPDIACLFCDLGRLGHEGRLWYCLYFCFRIIFFWALVWVLIRLNVEKIRSPHVLGRFALTLLVSLAAYGLYELVTINYRYETFVSIRIFQFIVIGMLSGLTGYVYLLLMKQREKEREIERLKVENLQSRCDALVGQINPHFFFNSLNGISSLICKDSGKEQALSYIDKLSDVFRYILRSDRKGLVTLAEELSFIEAFSHVMKVRFANKLFFETDVPENKMDLKIPVLSLLPLLENVTVHNIIDSEHVMTVKIMLDADDRLVISNPCYPKLTPPDTNGIGLSNLKDRFRILVGTEIKAEKSDDFFIVTLPLI